MRWVEGSYQSPRGSELWTSSARVGGPNLLAPVCQRKPSARRSDDTGRSGRSAQRFGAKLGDPRGVIAERAVNEDDGDSPPAFHVVQLHFISQRDPSEFWRPALLRRRLRAAQGRARGDQDGDRDDLVHQVVHRSSRTFGPAGLLTPGILAPIALRRRSPEISCVSLGRLPRRSVLEPEPVTARLVAYTTNLALPSRPPQRDLASLSNPHAGRGSPLPQPVDFGQGHGALEKSLVFCVP
jgi:hypothetical protein